MENKHLFPVGNIDLYIADYASSKEVVEIDLFGEDGAVVSETASDAEATDAAPNSISVPVAVMEKADENDFEITAEELAGIEFVPTAQRMQTLTQGGGVKGNKINFKTIMVKGLLWALIGAFVGFGVSELTENNLTSDMMAARISGHSEFVEYYEYTNKANEAWDKAYDEFETYCKKQGIDSEDGDAFVTWYEDHASDKAIGYLDDYSKFDDKASDELYDACQHTYDEDEDDLGEGLADVTRNWNRTLVCSDCSICGLIPRYW